MSALLAVRPQQPALMEEAFSLVLKERGRVLDSLMEQRALACSGSDPAFAERYRQWRLLNERLSRTYFTTESSGRLLSTMKELVKQKGHLEAELSERSHDFKESSEDVDLAKIGQILPHNTVLVYYWSHRQYQSMAPPEKEWRETYLAFVHGDSGRKVSVFDLGDAADLDTAAARFLKRISATTANCEEDEAHIREAGKELYCLAFRPLERAVGDAHQVLVVADGELSRVPFGALCDDADDYLIKRYAFNYLDSARQMWKLSGTRSVGAGTLVYGDPDYDLPPEGKEELPGGLNLPPETGASPDEALLLRGRARAWPRLPGTRAECALAERQLAGISPPGAVRLETDALKERFKAEVKDKRFLYVATHGFQLTEALGEKTSPKEPASDRFGPSGAMLRSNPLLSTGLVFAGANRAQRGDLSERADNGWLSALEVSGLDLDGVELVVLSACKTGSGSMVRGEGIFGLRRAFLHAGAGGLVMSLWAVLDRETQELMGEFCRLLRECPGLPRAEILRRAQLAQMSRVERCYGVPHPLFWGGFIYGGAWD